jgi:tetratricopeptide (TPR) repeat protein
MARLLMRQRRPQDAQPVLQRYLQRSPDFWAYNLLGDSYRAQGRFDLWEETLEECLKNEDLGLDHTEVKTRLARHYMDRKEWQKALPHAQAAAASGAGRALVNLGACYEALGQWDRSEELARAVSLRYESGAFTWFAWCARTGRGDLPAALRAGLKSADRTGRLPKIYPLLKALDALIRKEPNQALQRLEGAREADPLVHLLTFVLAEEVGRPDLRDAAAKQLPADQFPGRLAGLFQTALAERDGELDLKAAEQLLARQKPADQSAGACFIGLFLERRGQTEAALRYYERCIHERMGVPYVRALASVGLRAHGRDPHAKRDAGKNASP